MNEELNKEREERNFFQLERDRIESFWEITKNELAQLKAESLNKDREIEEQEEKHQVEIKVRSFITFLSHNDIMLGLQTKSQTFTLRVSK